MVKCHDDDDFLKSLVILYVEDDEDVRDQLSQYLRRRVGTLITAVNGVEGVKAFRAHPPHIVITDILMPEMDGLEMIRMIREEDRNVPIIVITAFEKIDFLLRCIDLGIDKYVMKPVAPERLYSALYEAVQRLRLQKRLEEERELRLQTELALKEVEVRQQLNERIKELREKVENEERSRISRDIHDSLGQLLVSLKLNLKMLHRGCLDRGCDTAPTLKDLVTEISTAANELHDIVVALRPAFLETTELDEALRWLCARLKARIGMDLRLVTSGSFNGVDDALKLAFFRSCQESLNNVVKHARATTVVVSLVRKGENLRLVIKDDGCGTVGEPMNRKSGHGSGLSMMKERMELVKGTLSIVSSPEMGTAITVEAPLS